MMVANVRAAMNKLRASECTSARKITGYMTSVKGGRNPDILQHWCGHERWEQILAEIK